MNRNEFDAYLKRAREIIVDRSQVEIDYDDAIVDSPNRGMDFNNVLRGANKQYVKKRSSRSITTGMI